MSWFGDDHKHTEAYNNVRFSLCNCCVTLIMTGFSIKPLRSTRRPSATSSSLVLRPLQFVPVVLQVLPEIFKNMCARLPRHIRIIVPRMVSRLATRRPRISCLYFIIMYICFKPDLYSCHGPFQRWLCWCLHRQGVRDPWCTSSTPKSYPSYPTTNVDCYSPSTNSSISSTRKRRSVTVSFDGFP